jgi:hypothetical protein
MSTFTVRRIALLHGRLCGSDDQRPPRDAGFEPYFV